MELRGVMSTEQQARWTQIKADFLRNKAMGGEDADVGQRMVAQLADISSGLQGLASGTARTQEPAPAPWAELLAALDKLRPAKPTRANPEPVTAARVPDPLVNELFDVLRATLVRQDLLNDAYLELLDAQPVEAATTTASASGDTGDDASMPPRRRLRARTDREREFDKMLEKLRFRHEGPPTTKGDPS